MDNAMRIAIIADCYTPLRSSAAVMLEDLATELSRQGHYPVVIVPGTNIDKGVSSSNIQGVEIIRVSAPIIKDIGLIRRTVAEMVMPFIMLRKLKRNGAPLDRFDGIIWYSPSIFHGPLVKKLKDINGIKSYLILRDIFPEWAVNLEVMSKGIHYLFFKIIEQYQYAVADRIGVQTPANLQYFSKGSVKISDKIEVLQNWMMPPDGDYIKCSISLAEGPLADRKIFLYPGNIGRAQNISKFLSVIAALDEKRTDIGFVFVGRGSEAKTLTEAIGSLRLSNVLIFEEIPHEEMPALYAQCNFGMVFLDPRHKTHNVPGKFVSFMWHGLPTLACLNRGNDLIELMRSRRLGYALDGLNASHVTSAILEMVDNPDYIERIPENCRIFANEMYSSNDAAAQIVNFLANTS